MWSCKVVLSQRGPSMHLTQLPQWEEIKKSKSKSSSKSYLQADPNLASPKTKRLAVQLSLRCQVRIEALTTMILAACSEKTIFLLEIKEHQRAMMILVPTTCSQVTNIWTWKQVQLSCKMNLTMMTPMKMTKTSWKKLRSLNHRNKSWPDKQLMRAKKALNEKLSGLAMAWDLVLCSNSRRKTMLRWLESQLTWRCNLPRSKQNPNLLPGDSTRKRLKWRSTRRKRSENRRKPRKNSKTFSIRKSSPLKMLIQV